MPSGSANRYACKPLHYRASTSGCRYMGRPVDESVCATSAASLSSLFQWVLSKIACRVNMLQITVPTPSQVGAINAFVKICHCKQIHFTHWWRMWNSTVGTVHTDKKARE